MKKNILLKTLTTISILFTAGLLSAHGQSGRTIDLKIKGIGIESSYAAVVRQLGNPVRKKQTKAIEDDCSGARFHVDLVYSGLTIRLSDVRKSGSFTVNSIEISSAKWIAMLGVPAGASMSQVRAKFGTPGSNETYDGFRILGYSMKQEESGASFYFKAGKLAKVELGQNQC